MGVESPNEDVECPPLTQGHEVALAHELNTIEIETITGAVVVPRSPNRKTGTVSEEPVVLPVPRKPWKTTVLGTALMVMETEIEKSKAVAAPAPTG